MAASLPQHSPPQQRYAYPSYPPHYPPHQYGPQPHAPQQFEYPQTGPYPPPYQQPYHQPYQQPYQQPYHQPPRQTYKPQVAQPTPHTCYNCGSPDHWAQDCPEPRREIPAGDLERQNNIRPPKRQKSNAPVITKYPVPSHPNQGYGPPQGYGGPPYTQPTSPQYQVPYGPPTPMSAHSPQYPQWQQGPHQQPYQPPYHQGSPYHSQPYAASPPASSAAYAPNQPSPVSAQGHYQHPGFYPSHVQFQQQQSSQAPSYTNASPINTETPHPAADHGNIRRRPSEMSVTMKSETTTPKPQVFDSITDEVDEEDLSCLDVPDIPRDAGRYGGQFARLVGHPLPADAIEADTIGPLPPPAFEDDGHIQSRYLVRDDVGSLLENIKSTADWATVKDDVIFHFDVDDVNVIPVEEWAESRERVTVTQQDKDYEKEDGELTQEINADGCSRDAWDIMDSLELALNNGNGSNDADGFDHASAYYKSTLVTKRPLRTQQQQVAGLEEEDTARAREDKLAALGVTGAPKPVRAPARPYPPPESRQELQDIPHNHEIRSRSNSPTRNDSISHQRQRSVSVTNSQHRLITSASQRHDPYEPDEWIPYEQQRHYDSPPADIEESFSNENTYHRYPQPPPPPPKRKSSNLDDNNYSPNGNGCRKYSADLPMTSPARLRLEKANSRKREYDTRDSSDDERENERRRQVDDVTPKLKRRQPKVAEAYSRRW